ncbi:hypothetical protein GEMRC1_008054 [Eukaryota sp. GEM-RC1]
MGTGYLYYIHYFTALTQTIAWICVFFFASAAASSAYLSIAELFPSKIRGSSIAVLYSFGTLVGALGPSIFGVLLDLSRSHNDRIYVVYGYFLAAITALFSSITEIFLGVAAEGKSLEDLEIQVPGLSDTDDDEAPLLQGNGIVQKRIVGVNV